MAQDVIQSFIQCEIPYFQVPNNIFDLDFQVTVNQRIRKKGIKEVKEIRRSLKANEKIVYIYLCRCGNNGKSIFPSYSAIAKKCGISRSAAIEIIEILKNNNIIFKKKRERGTSNIYVLNGLQQLQETNDKLVCQANPNSTPGIPEVVRQANPNSTPGELNKELTIKNNFKKELYINIVNYLNEKTNKNYKATTKKTQSLIQARLSEGFTEEEFRKVIDNKVVEWTNTQWEKYLRPETLFGTKFEGYLNQNNRGGDNGGPGQDNKKNKYDFSNF